MSRDDLVVLGTVVSTHARHGELKVHLFNPLSTALSGTVTILLRRGAELQERRVVALRPHKGCLLVSLDGCDSMTAAEALVGYEVCVHEAELPPAGPDEVYHYQLLGMTVVTTAGAELGVVADIIATGSNDVCVVRGDTHEHLIPLIADVVKQVDRERQRLVIDPLPGLLED